MIIDRIDHVLCHVLYVSLHLVLIEMLLVNFVSLNKQKCYNFLLK